MSGRLSLPQWTNHPAFGVFGFVFLVRDLVLTALAIGAVLAGGLANRATLSLVAVGLGALAVAGVVASTIAGQRRAATATLLATGASVPPSHDAPPERPPAIATFGDAVADQVKAARQLRSEMRDVQDRGAWDDEGWAYRKRVEAWTRRAAGVLEGWGRDDLARALAEVEAPPPPPFETLLKGHSPAYARLVGLLEARIALLERSQG
jgi:hypothetical protein